MNRILTLMSEAGAQKPNLTSGLIYVLDPNFFFKF